MELQEATEKHCATKVELMAFREETAINFGKVNVAIAKTHADLSAAISKTHVEIANIEVKIAATELCMVKWSIATAITLTGAVFAIARFVH